TSLRRIVAEVRDAHEQILGGDGVQGLGDARVEGNDALRRRGQLDGAPDLVHDVQPPRARGNEREEGQSGGEADHGERSVTPADWKVAISARISTAAVARPIQSAAPVPSPSRICRSR